MKYLQINITMCLLALTSCKEDDVTLPTCETNASMIINGNTHCGRAEVTGYILDLDENRESIGVLLNPGGDIYTNEINLVLAPPAGNLFIEGKKYDYHSNEGFSFSGNRIGPVQSASLEVIKLDRENQLLTIEVKIDVEILPSYDPWILTSRIIDLEMTP